MDLGIAALQAAYEGGHSTPSSVVKSLYPHWQAAKHAFIHLIPLEQLLVRCAALEAGGVPRRQLHGVICGVKDNVDVAGMPTTAACAAFAYTPTESAPAVVALEAAGAIVVGKTNLDQFASGLVGTRSPYGVPANAFDDRFIPGGSSSGSAALVGAGLLSFALGTDTAGSGRVPAGYNGCVGVKGTVGLISTVGVVPACASLDCLTVFARSVEDGAAVARIMAAADAGLKDVWRRQPARPREPPAPGAAFRFALPGPEFLEWGGAGGDAMAAQAAAQYQAAVERMQALGGQLVPIDFSPFAEAAAMLYGGSLVAERYSGLRPFLDAQPDGAAGGAEVGVSAEVAGAALRHQAGLAGDGRLLPVIRAIISRAGMFTATDAHDDTARLAALRARARHALAAIDCLLVPTALEHYLVAEVEAEEGGAAPVWHKNARNGRFTNFVNTLDYCGLSVPQGLVRVDYGSAEGARGGEARVALLKQAGGPLQVTLPFGVTLLSHAFWDEWLWALGARLAAAGGQGCGPAGHGLDAAAAPVRVRLA